MITAKQATELSGPTKDEYLSEIESFIREAAMAKRKYVIIRKDPYSSWLYDKNNISPTAKKTVEELSKAGFTVKLFYQENQFVDIGLWIGWE